MKRPILRRGFTLLEVLAASVLLGLLVTLILTLFKQGEIAWSMGESSAEGTGCQERFLVRAAREGAETVFVTDPQLTALRLLSAWNENGEIRSTRPIVRTTVEESVTGQAVRPIVLESTTGRSSVQVEVIVTSAGPDGQWETEDDLTTAPLGGVE